MSDKMLVLSRIKKTILELSSSGIYPLGNGKILELIFDLKGQDALEAILADKASVLLLSQKDYFIIPPAYVYRFISQLAGTIKPQKHMDPWLTLSSPALFSDFGETVGYCKDMSLTEAFRLIRSDFADRILWEDIRGMTDSSEGVYDLITSFLPFGSGGGADSSLNMLIDILVKSSLRLSENGKGLFLVPGGFLLHKQSRQAMLNAGLYMDAMISIPRGALSSLTGIDICLVVISKKNTQNIFVAELSSDEKSNFIILENFISRADGAALQLGKNIEFDVFTSYRDLHRKTQHQKLIEQIVDPKFKVGEIAVKISPLRKYEYSKDVPLVSNAIYFPEVFLKPVTATIPDKVKLYTCIEFDTNGVSAEYVSKFFNGEIGSKQREYASGGVALPRINSESIKQLFVYLPDIQQQTDIIDIDNKIDDLVFVLGQLKKKLWDKPSSYLEVTKELGLIDKDECLERWIDKLPFPLSSILWQYYVTKNNVSKKEHLLHFFEALSEFLSMIMLSALSQNIDFYRRESHNWIGTDKKFTEWYLNANFGGWNILTGKLSKATGQFLNNEKYTQECLDWYGNPSSQFVDMITDEGIKKVLFAVGKYRNGFKGHTSISNEDITRQQLVLLEQQLNKLKTIISNGFDSSWVISPSSSRYQKGLYFYTVKVLVGARTPFEEKEIQTIIPLDEGRLYLYHENQSRPLLLFPFMKFVSESKAVYFYSSVESKHVRWVSYHFEQNPEMEIAMDDAMRDAFELLKRE